MDWGKFGTFSGQVCGNAPWGRVHEGKWSKNLVKILERGEKDLESFFSIEFVTTEFGPSDPHPPLRYKGVQPIHRFVCRFKK